MQLDLFGEDDQFRFSQVVLIDPLTSAESDPLDCQIQAIAFNELGFDPTVYITPVSQPKPEVVLPSEAEISVVEADEAYWGWEYDWRDLVNHWHNLAERRRINMGPPRLFGRLLDPNEPAPVGPPAPRFALPPEPIIPPLETLLSLVSAPVARNVPWPEPVPEELYADECETDSETESGDESISSPLNASAEPYRSIREEGGPSRISGPNPDLSFHETYYGPAVVNTFFDPGQQFAYQTVEPDRYFLSHAWAGIAAPRNEGIVVCESTSSRSGTYHGSTSCCGTSHASCYRVSSPLSSSWCIWLPSTSNRRELLGPSSQPVADSYAA